jgi:DNA-binding transcriptional ArsR family regulator
MQQIKLPHDHGQKIEDVVSGLPRDEDFGTLSDLFRQLSDPSRMRIFWILCHCEECVINLSAMVEMSSPAVSHHLKMLKSAGLIVSRREGKEVYYKAAESETVHELHHMMESLMEISCP